MTVNLRRGTISGAKALGCDEYSLVFDHAPSPCRRVKRPPLQCLRIKSVDQFFGTKRAEGVEKRVGVNCSPANAVNRFLHGQTIPGRNYKLYMTAALNALELKKGFLFEPAKCSDDPIL